MFFRNSEDFNQRVYMKAAEFCEQVASEMGAELHDEVIQKFAALLFFIDRIDNSINEPVELQKIATQMRADCNTLIQSVRLISQRLNPVHHNICSFNQSIVNLCDSMEQSAHTRISCDINGDDRPLSQLSFTYLYRIVQELIQNAVKHSSAWHVAINIIWGTNSLLIEVEDDGVHHLGIDQIIASLVNRRNTLQMRCQSINAKLHYLKGKKGLLVRVEYTLSPLQT